MATRRVSTARFIDIVSYIAVILIGIALVIISINNLARKEIIGAVIVNTCQYIAQVIAYAILAWNSYFYALSRGTKNWKFIVWIIAVVLIIVFFILGII